ncbi:MAG: hypothetical protein SGPRY_013236, partial [Prymnesium sp.]
MLNRVQANKAKERSAESKRSSSATSGVSDSKEKLSDSSRSVTEAQPRKHVEINTTENVIAEIELEIDPNMLRSVSKRSRKKKLHPVLMDWTVLATGTVLGKVYQKDNAAPGATVQTNAISGIDLSGSWGRQPAILTKSGTLYILGNPSAEQAEHIQRL